MRGPPVPDKGMKTQLFSQSGTSYIKRYVAKIGNLTQLISDSFMTTDG